MYSIISLHKAISIDTLTLYEWNDPQLTLDLCVTQHGGQSKVVH